MDRWRARQEPTLNPMAGEIFCVGTDGTGTPMRRRHLRGRKGKNGGRARTREVKVGTVFTHRKPALPNQRPQRDYASTTYLAAIVQTTLPFMAKVAAQRQNRSGYHPSPRGSRPSKPHGQVGQKANRV